MKFILLRWYKAASRFVVTLTAIAVSAAGLPAQGAAAPAAAPAAVGAARDYTQADVDFTQGMIIHHAQAVVMSDWAATHGARPNLLLLCKRIALSQRDEITMMQHWLQDRHLTVPDPLHMLQGNGTSMHDMNGMDGVSGTEMPGMDMGNHPMMMPGMLTPTEMRKLDAAQGSAFDRLYLTGMIKHHQGALGMVVTLFATPSGGQQPEIFSFATDVDAGQRVEMARMHEMLNTLTPSQTK